MFGQPGAAAVALAGLVVLSGCGGVTDLGGSGADREPYSVPSVTESDREPTPEPTTAGGVDAYDLLSGHVAALGDRSVTVRERRVERYANGTVRRARATVVYAGNRSEYYRVDRLRGTVPQVLNDTEGRYEVWRNETVGVVRLSTGDRTDFERPPSGDESPGGDVARFERLFLLITTLDPAVTEQSRENGTVTVLRANQSEAGATLDRRGVRALKNVSLVVVIGPDGVVERYRLRYTGTVEGKTVRVVERGSFEAVGSTTVPRPNWVDRGLAALKDEEPPL